MGVGDGGWFGGEDCGGSRARLLGTGLRRHDGGGGTGVLVNGAANAEHRFRFLGFAQNDRKKRSV